MCRKRVVNSCLQSISLAAVALILYTTATGITKADVTYEQIKSSLSQGQM